MRARPADRYELFTCGWKGHVLVGLDAAEVADADPVLVRQYGGLRWHHCLRCNTWTAKPVPDNPGREGVPTRDGIQLPLRGPLLRDRYVLRLIAFDRAIHVALLSALAFVIFFFVGNHAALHRDYTQIIQAFGGPSRSHPFLGRFQHYFTITPKHLDETGAAVAGFAALEAIEMVGLWFAKRWAEYLTFIATVALLPLEVYELTSGISALKLVTFVVNLAIALYLMWAKRLFGINGGNRAEEARRRAAGDWGPLEDGLEGATAG
ncbi:MAG TPA: DUF2127 domain-containing protein [Acidimicrobiales bacterium]|nr:DUF2127 domain-containing protein [Acidimicrobiales bacterium]